MLPKLTAVLLLSQKQATRSVADQLISSSQNLILVVLCAKASSPSEFGAVSVGITVLTISIGVAQARFAEPLLINLPGVDRRKASSLGRSAIRRSIIFGLYVAVSCSIVSAGFSKDVQLSLLLSAGLMPGLIALDTTRYVFISQGKSGRALALDTLWVTVWVAGLLSFRPSSAVSEYAVWGVAGYVSVLVFLPAVGLSRSRVRSSDKVRKQLRYDGNSIVFEFVSLTASAQVFTLMVPLFAGLAEAGGLRVVSAIFGPLNTVTNAIRAALIPAVSSRFKAGRPFRFFGWGISLFCTVLTTALLVGALFVSKARGTEVFGQTWEFAVPLILASGVQRLMSAFGIGALTILRSAGGVRKSVWIRSIATFVTYLATIAVVAKFSLVAGLWVTAIGGGATSIALWVAAFQLQGEDTKVLLSAP